MRFKVAEQEDMTKGFDIHDEVKRRRAEVEGRLDELGVKIIDSDDATEYAYRYRIQYDGDMKKLADYIEDVEGTEILSIGHALELIKDLGDAGAGREQYGLRKFNGHPCHRPYPHGDGIRCRHPLGPSLLGLSLQRHRRRP